MSLSLVRLRIGSGNDGQPALFEFGTGFLPPETGASKRDLKLMSPCRDRKSETTTRENWPQKRSFC